MNRKLFNALQVLNVLFQAIYSLALPIGIGVLVSYLLTRFASVPGWIYAVMIILGVLMGLYSMVKYILIALGNMDRAEKQYEENVKLQREKEEHRERLRSQAKIKENEGEKEKSE